MTVVALGERALVEPYALAGAVLLPAQTPGEVRAAWQDVPADALVVLLTPAAARALADERGASGPMTVELPEAAP